MVHMSILTESPARGESMTSNASAPVSPPRCEAPEWHTLRLFGRRRHPDAFEAAAEKRTDR